MHFNFRLDGEILGANIGLWVVFIIHSGPVFGAYPLSTSVAQGRTSYLSIGHMSEHMLIGGINALPYSSHMPTMHIWNLIQVSSKMQIS